MRQQGFSSMPHRVACRDDTLSALDLAAVVAARGTCMRDMPLAADLSAATCMATMSSLKVGVWVSGS